VLDFRASGNGCGTDGISVSVHQRAQALLLRFIAGRVQLLLGKRHPALQHAPDAKILIRSAPASFCFRTYADFVRRPGLLASPLQRTERCEQARPGEHAFVDGIAQGSIRG
jgi:hypothetical protein